MKLALLIWLSGLLSASIFAYLAFRASLLHRQAKRMQDRVDASPRSTASLIFTKLSEQLRLEAGWRPRDHGLIVVAIVALVVNQLLSGLELLL